MKRLNYFGLRGNNITDSGIPHLAKLPSLTELHLGETGITDKGATALAALGQMQKLWLHDTKLTDAIVPRLARLKQLQSLYLYRPGSRSTACAACKRRCRNAASTTAPPPSRNERASGETVWPRA